MFHFLDPCETVFCGPNAQCMLINNEAKCLCSNGYTGTPDGAGGGCVDIDECVANPCTSGAICNNEPGGFSCECPGGTSGDAYREGCTKELPFSCSKEKPCPGSEQCVRDEFVGSSVCICQRGYTRDHKTGRCRDIDECSELRDKPACGLNAVCRNLPGSYECQCPPGFNGNPFALCEGKSFVFSCMRYYHKLYFIAWLFKLCCFIKVSVLEDFVSRYF